MKVKTEITAADLQKSEPVGNVFDRAIAHGGMAEDGAVWLTLAFDLAGDGKLENDGRAFFLTAHPTQWLDLFDRVYLTAGKLLELQQVEDKRRTLGLNLLDEAL